MQTRRKAVPAPMPPPAPADLLPPRLMPVLEQVMILSPTRFQIGQRPPVDVTVTAVPAASWRPAGRRTGPPAPIDQWPPALALAIALWPALYDAAYARPYRPEPEPTPVAVTPDNGLATALAAGFPEAVRWDPGWRVYQTEPDGSVHVMKGDACRRAMPGSFLLPPGSFGPVTQGASLLLPLTLATATLQPGFFHLAGTSPHSDHDDALLARFYFNSRPEGLPAMLRRLVDLLNEYQVAFRMKTLLDPTQYDRFDSTVLYVPRRLLPITLALIADLLEGPALPLAPGVPLFSLPIAEGIGVADDPGFGLSFGQSRAMLLAEAIIEGWLTGHQDAATRLALLPQVFARHGLDLARPHLSPGNHDVYRLPTQGERQSWM